MQPQFRTDLAVEAREIWQQSTTETTELSGVKAYDKLSHGYNVTHVEISTDEGAQALSKPQGTYITVELDSLVRREEDAFSRGVAAIRDQLSPLLQLDEDSTALVIGLGNRAITPDAVGPLTAKHTLATRHLVDLAPESFGSFRRVSVLQPGVLGQTGIESADIVAALVRTFQPSCVIVVDALASRKLSRLCRTVQISNTGIAPGSGIGNRRTALTRETLGVPVIAIGVPTVIDAETFLADLTNAANLPTVPPESLAPDGRRMIVTPKEIDTQVADIAKLLGYALNFTLHAGLTIEDIDMLVS